MLLIYPKHKMYLNISSHFILNFKTVS